VEDYAVEMRTQTLLAVTQYAAMIPVSKGFLNSPIKEEVDSERQ
jgi:hypothetical protein